MGSAKTTARSRIKAVPTVVGEPSSPAGQLDLGLGEPPRDRREVLPGAIHIPDWLDLGAQRALVDEFRVWAAPPAGLRHPRVPSGHLMTVQSVCLGWHW